jgi:hypothetical protein
MSQLFSAALFALVVTAPVALSTARVHSQGTQRQEQQYLGCNYVASLTTKMFDERISYSKDVTRWLILKYLQTSDFTTESQALSQGVKLNIVYEAIPIGGTDDKKFSQLMEYKRTRLQQDIDAGFTESEEQLYTRALNTPGVGTIKEMYDQCQRSSSPLVTCRADLDGETIIVGLDFNPAARLNVPTPSVTGGTISNARLQREASATSVSLRRLQIPPGGRSLIFYRADPAEPVVFSIATTQGDCRVDAIPARGRYSVSIQISAIGTEKVPVAQRLSAAHDHRNCYDILTYNSTPEICLSESAKLEKVVVASRPQNEWAVRSNRGQCFQATGELSFSILPGRPNCASVSTQLRECFVDTLCLMSLGPRRSSYTLEASGSLQREARLVPELFTFPSQREGVLEARYSATIPESFTVTKWSWVVSLHDQSTGRDIRLTESDSSESGFVSSFDAAKRTLTVAVPRQR